MMHLNVNDVTTPTATHIDRGIFGEPDDSFDLLERAL
jgi:hypothetical protein